MRKIVYDYSKGSINVREFVLILNGVVMQRSQKWVLLFDKKN